MRNKTNKSKRFLRRREALFALAALPAVIIWGLLAYRFIITPRAPGINEANKKSEYYFEASSRIFGAKIGSKQTNEPKVEFAIPKTDKSVVFYPASARSGLAKPGKSGKQIIFKDVYQNTDFIYQTTAYGIKEDIKINKPNGISTYPFYIEPKNVTPKYFTQDLAGGVFYDENKNYLFHFEKPFAVDAKGARTEKAEITIKKDDKNGKLVALLYIDKDWVSSPERSYPIVIDPTIVHDTTAEFATGQLNRVKDVGSGSSPALETYYQELPADQNTVGLWHMNESADNTCSGGQDACDSSGNGNHGTATGTTINTTSQRLGAGARTFNGTSDYIAVSDNSTLDLPANYTWEAWVNPSSFSTCGATGTPTCLIFNKENSYEWAFNNGGTLEIAVTPTWSWINTSISAPTGQWTHFAVVYNGSFVNVYKNGSLSYTFSKTGTPDNTALSFRIGSRELSAGYFAGSLDEIKISNIARTPEEIKLSAQRRPYSVYTSDVIDFTSNVLSWNSLSWSEHGVATGDGETLKDGTSLVAQWNFNETSGTTATANAGSCGASCNGTLTNFASTASQDAAAGTGWTANNKRWGAGSLMFDGTNDYVSVPYNSAQDISGAITITAWVKQNTVTGSQNIVVKGDTAVHPIPYQFSLSGGSLEIYQSQGGVFQTQITGGYVLAPGQWHYVVFTNDLTTAKLYVDGLLYGTDATPATTPTQDTEALGIGASGAGTIAGFFNGVIDSVALFSRALSAAEIMSNYNTSNVELQTRVGADTSPDDGSWEAWKPTTGETAIASMDSDAANWSWDNTATYMPQAKSNESTIKVEGTGSLKQIVGQPQSDANTVALWHMDETGGTGAYIKDSTANANHLTPTGSSTANGISSKSRDLDGSADVLVKSSPIGLPTGASARTIELWIKPDNVNPGGSLVHYGDGSGGGQEYILQMFNSAGIQYLFTDGVNAGNNITITGAEIPPAGKWSHIAFTLNGSNSWIYYLNGVSTKSGTFGTAINTATPNILNIGDRTDTAQANFPGPIDEVRISNTARSAEEIAEAYRAGQDHYLNKTISSTDLSAKTSLPFYVASDRPGTYLEATVGESAYANYQPDSSTVGLWHLDEQSGSGAYLKDFSGNNRNATPTNSTFATGKIGKGRFLDGSGDYINVGKLGSKPAGTISLWFKENSTAATNEIFSDVVGAYENGNFVVDFNTGSGGNIQFLGFLGAGWDLNLTVNRSRDTNWHLLTASWDASALTSSLYYDGKLISTDAISSGFNGFNTNDDLTFGYRSDTVGSDFNGSIDEVRIDNIARTANEIRQAYEIGLRTHPVTIDFGAKLDSGNLITGTSDLSFTVDATYYGLNSKGSNLYKGDKIIVKENVDGTEYIAQGTVTAVTASTGAVTVAAWDSGSTVPTGGFTVNASVFKWQREYWNVTEPLNGHLDGSTTLTIRLLDGVEGRTIWLDDLKSNSEYLTTPGGSTITSSTGNRYFQYRAVLSSFDEAVTATVSAVTVNYTINVAPNTPTLDEPLNAATNQSLTPRLKTTTTDTDSDYLRYKIEMCTNALMTLNCQTFDQTSSQTGWSGQNTQSSTAYTSGTQGVYSVQTPLTALTTYYWRSYAIDPGGINIWSGTQATPYSFTTSNNPLAPSSLLAEGATNPIGVTDTTPEFSAVCNHEGASMIFNKYRIQVATSGDFASPVWDSGASGTTMTNCLNGTRSQDISFGGTPLALDGTVYYWRIDFWDTAGNESPWSTEGSFFKMDTTASDAPTNCRIAEGAGDSSLTLLWNDNSASETQFRIEKNTNAGGFLFLINKAAGSTSHLDSSVSQGNTYQYRVRAEGTTNSDWCTTNIVSLQAGTFQFGGLDIKGVILQ